MTTTADRRDMPNNQLESMSAFQSRKDELSPAHFSLSTFVFLSFFLAEKNRLQRFCNAVPCLQNRRRNVRVHGRYKLRYFSSYNLPNPQIFLLVSFLMLEYVKKCWSFRKKGEKTCVNSFFLRRTTKY